MNFPNMSELVVHFLDQGFTVAYLDSDPARRETVKNLEFYYRPHRFKVFEPKLTGKSTLHYNILLTVNEQDFDLPFKEELWNIAGASNGNGSCIVRVSL